MMNWIIQDIFGEESLAFKKALEARGHSVKITNDPYEDIIPIETFIRGSHEFIDTCMKRMLDSQINPIYYDIEKYSCSNYYYYFGTDLLNYDRIFIDYQTLIFNKQLIFNAFPDSDTFFIRPNSGKKILTGTRIGKKTWSEEREVIAKLPDTKIHYNDLLLVSTAKEILAEWRFVVIDGMIITGSQYSGDDKDYDLLDLELFLARAISQSGFPEPIYTIDICLTPDGYKIVEINSFASAGLYDMDYTTVVEGLENAYFRRTI